MSESQKPKIWRRRLALPLYLLALLILDVSFQVLYGRTVGAWPGLPALGFSTLWILLLGAIVLLLPRALGRTFIVLSVLVCAVLVATHAVMYTCSAISSAFRIWPTPETARLSSA